MYYYWIHIFGGSVLLEWLYVIVQPSKAQNKYSLSIIGR